MIILLKSVPFDFPCLVMFDTTHSFCRYCTEILASLPFSCPDEPLYLIYDINRVVQLRAGAIESSIKMWSSSSQQQDSLKAWDENHMGNVFSVHQVSDQTLSDSTMTTSDNSCGISKEDLQKSQVGCFFEINSLRPHMFILLHLYGLEITQKLKIYKQSFPHFPIFWLSIQLSLSSDLKKKNEMKQSLFVLFVKLTMRNLFYHFVWYNLSWFSSYC